MSSLQESLKYFFLGLKKNKEPFLYKNKDLTTHATIIGMTGSGKTGLGITLLEEAAIDNIPSIIIDPKGDMTNLALAFPEMKEEDFLPYIGEDEIQSKGKNAKTLAKDLATTWRDGIENSYQSLDRVKLLKDSSSVRIYTPKSSDGLGVSLLSDFIAPLNLNAEELNEHTLSITTSLLSLLGFKDLETTSKESVLVQTIFLENFKNEKSLSLPDLIHQIVTPSFDKIGVFDVEKFYPSDKRMALAMKLNSLFASPSFSGWTMGERLNISKMLFDENAKARTNIFTISHLNDSERMFFVTLLLNEIISFMRKTDGTSSLRMIVYMDEIFGYFPPTANPPSKTPMLTLLKQARAHGIGVVLSTQNPVDLDYKGLSNIGSWFIGRLQTAGDRDRVISGLVGADATLDKNSLNELLANLKKREFLVKNINETGLEVISTRFALSYLKGPLNGEQISNLMSDYKGNFRKKELSLDDSKPIISPEIPEIYSYSNGLNLSPYLLGSAKVRYKGKNFEFDKDINLLYDLSNKDEVLWSEAIKDVQISLSSNLEDGAKFGSLPRFIAGAKNLSSAEKSLIDFIYRDEKLELFEALGEISKPGEEKSDFLLRLHDKCNQILEDETMKFESSFNKTRTKLEDDLQKALIRLDKEKSDVKAKGIDAAISIGSAILGAFLGSKKISKTNASKVATGARSAGRVMNERKDVELAQQKVEAITSKLEELAKEEKAKISELKELYSIKNLEIKTAEISAKKSDIFGQKVVLLWKS